MFEVHRILLILSYFINFINSQNLDMKIRYILPACVVSAVREHFPNTDGSDYRDFTCYGTDDGHTLT